MNIKTTLALALLVGAGVLLWWFGGPQLPPALDRSGQPAAVEDKGTRDFFADLRASKITRIEVQSPSGITELTRKPDGAWSLPGNWPIRDNEVNALVDLLAGLRSRFQPLPLNGDKELGDLGLNPSAKRANRRPSVTVLLTVDGEGHKLAFGEKPDDSSENRYSRDTYVRLDKKPEALRMAPGLIAALNKPRDYYQQRRLFQGEAVKKEGSREEEEQLAARSVSVADTKPQGVHFTLERRGGDWQLAEPVRDRLDAATRDAILKAVPDIWAEEFAPLTGSDSSSIAGIFSPRPFGDAALAATDIFFATQGGLLVRSGLLEPERTIAVKDDKGDLVTLQIGRVSGQRVKMVAMPQPPGMPPGMPQRMMPQREEYRYAKLQYNDQIFEIKGDKLKDVFVALDKLRDSRIARFNSADARRVEIQHGGENIVLEKNKDNWKLVKPLDAEADNAKVNDLLAKLSDLQAGDKGIIDKGDPKKYGFDKPEAVVTIVVEEEVKQEDKRAADPAKKKPRTLTVRVGKHDADKKKLYVMADDWPRINEVEDSLEPLVARSALAYRGKRLLDFNAADVAKIDIDNRGKKFALEHDKDAWRVADPRKAEADLLTVEQMVGDLGHLEAVEYITPSPKKDELEEKYGLGKSPLTVRVAFVDEKKPPQVLHVGKSRGGKDGYFAQLGDGAVFAINAELRNQLVRDALSYRPRTLWQMLPDEIVSLRVLKAGQKEYSLTRSDSGWKISGPFEASAFADTVQKMTAELASPKVESYKADAAKDLAEYGLDKPALTVTVRSLLQGKLPGEDDKAYTLSIGKPTAEGAASRYAKRANDPAIFTVGDPLVSAVDRGALAVLNRTLLEIDPAKLERVRVRADDNAMTLEKMGDAWRMVESPAGAFPVDVRAAGRQEALWLNLQAERFAAYGSGVEWAKYGLDKPAVSIAIKAGKAEHTVELGKTVESEPGARYARVDKGAGVAVLPLTTARVLTRTYLDYVNRTLLKFDAEAVTAVQRHAGANILEIVKKDNAWQITKPTAEKADAATMQQLGAQLGELRAARIAAYPVKDLKPFGLDAPAALVTIKLKADAKPAEHIIKLGKTTGQRGERFALVDDGKAVAVLPVLLAEQLAGPPLAFRERTLASFANADRLQLERGLRRAAFGKVDGSWKLTEPLPGEAEQDQLDAFLKGLSPLRADALVAEKPDAEQLKKYGLDRPETRWDVKSGGKDVLSLLVGSKESNGTRRYAKLAKGDLVFLLDPRLSQQVFDEYRPRAAWSPPLDAVQIESLNYRYSRNPFLLEKDGANWQAVGKADAKINAAAVEDTLAALAALKLSRYVVDKGANLPLFGLDKPELILEVLTRSGKRVLHIGNVESTSKGRYARIPDTDRGDVFVLDEETCMRIMRDLAAFGKPPAQKKSEPRP
jgi:hypothetical protein